MPNVISDTSALIALSNIDMLDLLARRYGHIYITPEVEYEFGESLPDWISVVPVKDPYKTFLLNRDIDIGEASTIALADETDCPLVILDDGKARRYAKSIGLKMTGTLGIIIKARDTGLITNAREVIDKLQKTNFRMPKDFWDNYIKQTASK